MNTEDDREDPELNLIPRWNVPPSDGSRTTSAMLPNFIPPAVAKRVLLSKARPRHLLPGAFLPGLKTGRKSPPKPFVESMFYILSAHQQRVKELRETREQICATSAPQLFSADGPRVKGVISIVNHTEKTPRRFSTAPPPRYVGPENFSAGPDPFRLNPGLCEQGLQPMTVARVASQMVDMLDFFHKQNLVVRDINPLNIGLKGDENDSPFSVWFLQYTGVRQGLSLQHHLKYPQYKDQKQAQWTWNPVREAEEILCHPARWQDVFERAMFPAREQRSGTGAPSPPVSRVVMSSTKSPPPPKHTITPDRVRFQLQFYSTRTLKGGIPTYRDDLESMMYTIAYLLYGTLPWWDSWTGCDVQGLIDARKNLAEPPLENDPPVPDFGLGTARTCGPRHDAFSRQVFPKHPSFARALEYVKHLENIRALNEKRVFEDRVREEQKQKKRAEQLKSGKPPGPGYHQQGGGYPNWGGVSTMPRPPRRIQPDMWEIIHKIRGAIRIFVKGLKENPWRGLSLWEKTGRSVDVGSDAHISRSMWFWYDWFSQEGFWEQRELKHLNWEERRDWVCAKLGVSIQTRGAFEGLLQDGWEIGQGARHMMDEDEY